MLDNQLKNYYEDVRTNVNFTQVEWIASLAKKIVELKKDIAYNKFYFLIKLALVLSVAIATVEKVFVAINLIKTNLRN